jgi:hypothetical protein
VTTIVVAGGVLVEQSPAYAAVPTISSVVVAGTTTDRVVTAGMTVKITGTGFTGMVDNNADPACSVTPVAASRCSQVRFNGIGATTATGFTLATAYVVVSDTTIYAAVPNVAAIAPATTAPAAGTGSMRVVVVNTMPGGTSSLSSAPGSTAGQEVLYRHRLGATLPSASVAANPLGGGALNVDVSNVAPLTSGTGGTLAQEKITARFTSVISGSPSVVATTVSYVDADTVAVTVPGGMPDGDYVSVMLVHDGIPGTPTDDDSLKYSAVITSTKTCSAFAPPVTTPLPTCTGPANSAANPAYVQLTGRGFIGATNFIFDGNDGTIGEDCAVYSDVTVYCKLTVTAVPSIPVVTVTFTPGDADGAGPRTAPVQSQVGTGAVFGFS